MKQTSPGSQEVLNAIANVAKMMPKGSFIFLNDDDFQAVMDAVRSSEVAIFPGRVVMIIKDCIILPSQGLAMGAISVSPMVPMRISQLQSSAGGPFKGIPIMALPKRLFPKVEKWEAGNPPVPRRFRKQNPITRRWKVFSNGKWTAIKKGDYVSEAHTGIGCAVYSKEVVERNDD